jgi:hypothetical protein
MAKRQKGDGHFSQAPKITKVKGDDLAEAKGENLSRVVYDENDRPAVHGTRLGFS